MKGLSKICLERLACNGDLVSYTEPITEICFSSDELGSHLSVELYAAQS